LKKPSKQYNPTPSTAIRAAYTSHYSASSAPSALVQSFQPFQHLPIRLALALLCPVLLV
jgi:hypothetical protein